ncbi:Rhodanese-like protein [Fistulina hepatica ATCC 64428]|uniref:Rhodanese-like protein n=1 Tax=Fistulina hepatica ATCC 64428 TaxID=1128425 RepID=A0A0D7AKS2_9AGAR|nr:Rhodanese-like protein [Fistulina hepatica ATCC 64428]
MSSSSRQTGSSHRRKPSTSSTSTSKPSLKSVQSQSTKPLSLQAVRIQVAHELALRTRLSAEDADGVKIGVFTTSVGEQPDFLILVADLIGKHYQHAPYLFAITGAGLSVKDSSPLLICGSSATYISRVEVFVTSKFVGRINSAFTERNGTVWIADVKDYGLPWHDDAALRGTLRAAVRPTLDPTDAPPGSRSVMSLLSEARARLYRLSPQQVYAELGSSSMNVPTFLIDIRPAEQRVADGSIPGALIVDRNSLEWRLDPRSDKHLPVADRYDIRAIVFCDDGSASSLAAAALHDLGLLNATDMIGGFSAWRKEGLPLADPVSSTIAIMPSTESDLKATSLSLQSQPQLPIASPSPLPRRPLVSSDPAE